ncbi:MAG: SCP2 sterol-binding domain-containing protein [Solirubrobacterales bacterium]
MTDRTDPAAAVANLDQVAPEDFARLMAEASRDQLEEIVSGAARKQVLDEIFRRMAEHVEPGKARGTNAVVHFKILDRPDHLGGGYDHYEVVFDDGTCIASDVVEREPNVTIRVAPVHFLKLAANQASGPTLFLTGKLRLEGDVMLASRLTSFFRIPMAA